MAAATVHQPRCISILHDDDLENRALEIALRLALAIAPPKVMNEYGLLPLVVDKNREYRSLFHRFFEPTIPFLF